MRLELMTRDSEIRRLREKIDTMERQIQQVFNIFFFTLHLYVLPNTVMFPYTAIFVVDPRSSAIVK
jgi:hypothetical protein